MALTRSMSFSLGRKRVIISNNSSKFYFSNHLDSFSPMKRPRHHDHEYFLDPNSDSDLDLNLDLNSNSDICLLEVLPQDILIKVVCGVDHSDLKQLFHVSKTLRNATVIAKQSHFAYSTPSKIKVFKNSNDFDDFEAPNAPIQLRKNNRPQINRKKLEDISVRLFTDDDDKERPRWPRRSLFMQI